MNRSRPLTPVGMTTCLLTPAPIAHRGFRFRPDSFALIAEAASRLAAMSDLYLKLDIPVKPREPEECLCKIYT